MCVYRFAIILSTDDYRTSIIGPRLSVSHPLPVPNEEWYWLIWRNFYENQKPLNQRFVRYYNHEKKKYQRFTVWKFSKFTLNTFWKKIPWNQGIEYIVSLYVIFTKYFSTQSKFLFHTVCFDQIYHPSTKFFWFIFAKIHSDTKPPP